MHGASSSAESDFRAQIRGSTSDYDREKLQERVARLQGDNEDQNVGVQGFDADKGEYTDMIRIGMDGMMQGRPAVARPGSRGPCSEFLL
jgi:hypothetical protein